MSAVGGGEDCRVRIEEIVDRAVVTIEGIIATLAHSPVGHSPALHAVITYDGLPADLDERHLEVVWLGRRRVAGIDVGTRLRVHGRVRRDGPRALVYNPRYELLVSPRAADPREQTAR